jgi:predicted nucleic acid-binding protein
VIVAAVCAWHEHNAAAIAELERRVTAGETMVVAGATLVEAYSVLTRLPAPYRLGASDAHSLITRNFVSSSDVAVLDGAAYMALLGRAAASGIVAGQIYDALVAECARTAGVEALITFNERHFRRVLDQAVSLIVPTL